MIDDMTALEKAVFEHMTSRCCLDCVHAECVRDLERFEKVCILMRESSR